jgi:hypothetical protein
MRSICAFTDYSPMNPDFMSINEDITGKVVMTTRHGGVTNQLEIPQESLESMHHLIGEYLQSKKLSGQKTVLEVEHIQV